VSSEETVLTSIPPFVARSGAWFLRSGIQEASGGVARYYRADIQKNATISTEITGYAVSTFVYLHQLSGQAGYLEAATRAARFLARQVWKPELRTFPFEYADGIVSQPPAYFFDCGIILRGLLAAWRATGESEFLETARAGGQSMAEDFIASEAIHPIILLPDKRPAPYGASWSRNPGCFQLKSAMAWLELAEATGDAVFLGYYERALKDALASQEAFLPGCADQEKVMDRLHAYCYFLEGLLPSGQRAECGRVLASGITRTAELLREIAPVFVRSDVYAQLLRARLFAADLGAMPLDRVVAEEEARRAAEFQLDDPDERVAGGYCFGRRASMPLPFVNPASTAFCMQALEMWRRYLAGSFVPNLQTLI